ncbi:hypothetical protein BDR26DRAFT_476076 [Obelidium mucronatum]|nr:hypothetical protein BDR26DRAFT_476076 [Obelidium mucronatum]
MRHCLRPTPINQQILLPKCKRQSPKSNRYQSTIAFQTTSLTEQEQEIAELKQKLSAAEANLEVSEDSASDAEATCRQLENKLEVLEASLAEKAGLLDGAQQKIRELSETMSLMESESKKSLSELREQQSILEKREADLTQYISGEKQRTEAIHKELIASKEALEGSYLYLESQLSDSQTELLTLRTASENFGVCEANLKQKISELETEVERLLAQFNAERAVAAESLVAMEERK